MSPFLFWIFAVLTVIFGAAVVLNRNPVASALSLVVSFLGLSALFMSLDAFFVGIIQVLVYAGAVMVLFLFIIMLLHIRTEELRRINWLAAARRGWGGRDLADSDLRCDWALSICATDFSASSSVDNG